MPPDNQIATELETLTSVEKKHDTQKIVSEFSLTQDGPDATKPKLQAFLDANYIKLCQDNPETIEALKNLLRDEILPPDRLDELKKVLAGQSDFAVLIHNLPERPDLEKERITNEKHLYSYFIGNAIYSLCGAESTIPLMLRREAKRKPSAPLVGENIHRDFLGGAPPSHIIFSSPHNSEQALTELIHMRRAIEGITEEQRRAIMVEIKTESSRKSYISLVDLLKDENNEFPNRIRSIDILPSKDKASSNAFWESLKKNSVKINIQPGDLLIFCEDEMYHRAHSGTPPTNIAPGTLYSRVFLHNAGHGISI